MVNTNVNALGVIFANTYDNIVPELVAERYMASIPFGGRYRLIDFTLSSMANAGIDNVSVIVRKNYHSLMDHLGAGREWDLTRKRGGLNIVLVSAFSGDLWAGTGEDWEVGVFVYSQADAEQSEAIQSIWSWQDGGWMRVMARMIKRVRGRAVADIRF